MSMNANRSTETPDPYRLTDIAAEMGTSVDEVARELGAANIFMFGGFRCATAVRGREMLEAHHRRKAEAARWQAEQQERHQAQLKAVAARHPVSRGVPSVSAKEAEATRRANAAVRAQLRSERNRVPGGVRLAPDDDRLPVVAVTAADPSPQYDGGTYRRVPSVSDWLFGENLEGGQFGPNPRKGK